MSAQLARGRLFGGKLFAGRLWRGAAPLPAAAGHAVYRVPTELRRLLLAAEQRMHGQQPDHRTTAPAPEYRRWLAVVPWPAPLRTLERTHMATPEQRTHPVPPEQRAAPAGAQQRQTPVVPEWRAVAASTLPRNPQP